MPVAVIRYICDECGQLSKTERAAIACANMDKAERKMIALLSNEQPAFDQGEG